MFRIIYIAIAITVGAVSICLMAILFMWMINREKRNADKKSDLGRKESADSCINSHLLR